MSKPLNLVGKRFGHLVVISRSDNSSSGITRWNCLCDCGNKCVVNGSKLVIGHTSSCGCIRRSTGFPIDLTGYIFGRLTVIGKKDASVYICKCSCGDGTILEVSRKNLVNGHTQSCGCLKRELSSKRNTRDLVGQKFGRLTVLERSGSTDKGLALWKCLCECGTIKIVDGSHLVNGYTRSCGCLQAERRIEVHTKWIGIEQDIISHFRRMKQRCYDKNYPDYFRWGGRGIYICDEWLEDPRKFVEWAKENGFSPELSIGRINNDGPYSPWNCRWETFEEQANNKSNNVRIYTCGFERTLAEWARLIDEPYQTLYNLYRKDPDRVKLLITASEFERSMGK